MSDSLNSRTLISASAARRKIGNPSRTTFWRISNDEELNFPKPVRLRGRVLYDEAEINQFIDRQLHERDKSSSPGHSGLNEADTDEDRFGAIRVVK